MATPALAVGKVNIVALSAIAPDTGQPRTSFDQVALKKLADSIKARGVLQPIQVRKDGKKLLIVDGERRWRAAKLARISKVPVLLVEAKGDAVQTRLDQVAVNQLREPLPPMDMARMLVRFRDEEKLSDNDIAARLEKDGIPYAGKKALGDVMALVTLPDWAQDMINAGEMTPEVAKPLYEVLDQKPILAALKKTLRNSADMGGRLTRIDYAVAAAALEAGVDLRKTEDYHLDPVRFNPAVVCKGCKDRRRVGFADICLNKKHFEEMQAQAIEAGLLPGGKKPKKAPTAEERQAGDTAEQETKAARKAELRGDKLAAYLEGWLRLRLVSDERVRPFYPHLVHWLAGGAPEGKSSHALQLASLNRGDVEAALKAITRSDLAGFLNRPLSEPEIASLAQLAVRAMPRHCLQVLAVHIGFKMAEEYRIDADYLELCKKAQLLELAEKAGLVGASGDSVGDIRAALMDAEAIAKIGVPGELMAVYSGPLFQPAWARSGGIPPDIELVCIGCGCSDNHPCEGGCSWIEEDLDAGVGLCSTCEEAHYERWLAGVRTPPGEDKAEAPEAQGDDDQEDDAA